MTDNSHTALIRPMLEHFFRHQATRLIAVLTRFFGWGQLQLVEDMVQESLLDAFQCWQRHGIPECPEAWMHRIARNKVIDALRRQGAELRAAVSRAGGDAAADLQLDELFDDAVLADSELRMIFACCHPRLAAENRIALILKILFAYSPAEVAEAIGASEAAVKKRLQRAKTELIDFQVTLDAPGPDEAVQRLTAVHGVLRALVQEANRGHLPVHVALAMRGEVLRLGRLLASDRRYATAETYSLLAQLV
ncbi:sigma-70 family RNA polymerase sigma factor [Anatilimnocola floriformis]|uniref:sigma-70 family RNA polymerase sigma factor n=1 Tax=Anatilimnocola floriformis TaxID=2948575 RepID=UPI0020C3B86A|nr:sigma-70 family RNA polymerase sigma factor [Anatilimnocola floriformis]